MIAHDDPTELLRHIREQLAMLHEALVQSTDDLAQRSNALAARIDDTNARVAELHALLDAGLRQTRDYMAALDRNAVRRTFIGDVALEDLDLSSFEEVSVGRTTRTDTHRTPDEQPRDSASLSRENAGMVDAPSIGHTPERRPAMDSHDNTQTEMMRQMWQQLVSINNALSAKIDTLSTKVDDVRTSLTARIDDTNLTLRAFMRQTHENFDRIDRELMRLDGRIDETNKSLSARIDETNATVKDFKQAATENIARARYLFEKVNERLEAFGTGQTRMDELDDRLTRIETHIGLRDE
jgi:uncharacterized coiled-coil DUF342 family protein